jgi:hypothetical protein
MGCVFPHYAMACVGEDAMIDQTTLAGFTGTEQYHRWSPLFRNMLLSDGTMYIAENGGTNGAFWLMDAIASYQPKLLKNPRLREYQLWDLTVKDESAVLTCRGDDGEKPVVRQKIEFTDFDLADLRLYVEPVDAPLGALGVDPCACYAKPNHVSPS